MDETKIKNADKRCDEKVDGKLNEINSSDYEETQLWALEDIPIVFLLQNKSYVLAAIIMFAPPANERGLGHYSAAVRINNVFEVYDDLRPKTYQINKKVKVCVHTLIYVSPPK